MSIPRVNVIAVFIFLAFSLAGMLLSIYMYSPIGMVLGALLGLLAALSPKIAKQWERGIVRRLGNYKARKGPGLFWILPLIDSVSAWIDQRTITTSFAAEQTLTSDTVLPPRYLTTPLSMTKE